MLVMSKLVFGFLRVASVSADNLAQCLVKSLILGDGMEYGG